MYKKNVFLLISLLFSVLCYAKTEYPEWMDSERRKTLYPSSQYYVGFAIAELGKDDVLEETMERLRQSAYGDLMSKISVSVQHQASDSVKDVVGTDEAYSQSVYSSSTTLRTRKVEIPGIEVNKFSDASSGVVAVLVYVKKDGLTAKLQRQLVSQITRMEVKLEDAANYLRDGYKNQAQQSVSEARNMLEMADETRKTMISIDSKMTSEELLDKEWRDGEVKIISIEKELNKEVKLFLQCTLNDSNDNSLRLNMSGELYRNGCEIVDNRENAEWIVNVSVTVEPYNKVTANGYVFYYSMAKAALIITDSEGNEAYSDELQNKGNHTKDFEYSSSNAVRKVTAKVCEIINQIVKK